MNTVQGPLASASRRFFSIAAIAATLPLVPSAFGQNVNSTLASSGGTANWGDSATWAPVIVPPATVPTATVPNATDAAVNIDGTLSNGLNLDLQDSSNVNQTYTIGNLSFRDSLATGSTFRDLVLQNGTLNVSTTSKTATWTQGTTSGGSQSLIIFAANTSSITSAADQTLILTSTQLPTNVTATDTTGPGFRFNSSGTWSGFTGNLTLARGIFQANASNSLPQNIPINLGSGTDAAYLRLGVSATQTITQTITALNGNAQSFIHSANLAGGSLNSAITINGSGNGSFAGTIGTNGAVGFSRPGVNITKTGSGTQTFTGTITNNGTVTVNAGTLVYDGAKIFTTGNTTVASGATLRINNEVSQVQGPTGVNSGSFLINSGGFLIGGGTLKLSDSNGGGSGLIIGGNFSPGVAGIGTFTIDAGLSTRSAVEFSAGATLSFDLGAGFTSDRLALVNSEDPDIFFTNNVISFTDLTSGLLSTGVYTLFTSDAAEAYRGISKDSNGFITGGLSIGATFLEMNPAYSAANLQWVGNNIVLNLTAAAIPEPSTFAALAGLGVLGLAVSRRRRSA